MSRRKKMIDRLTGQGIDNNFFVKSGNFVKIITEYEKQFLQFSNYDPESKR
jgi:hypothetical protein